MAQDILITPGSGEPQILFRGSGITDTPIKLNVFSSYQSATGSGTAIFIEGTQGQLFGVTDNLSSGTIFSVSDITGLPAIEYNNSGELKLGEYANNIYVYRGLKTPIKTATDGATITFDLNASNTHTVTLGGNRTLAISGVDIGQKFVIRLKQDSSGSRTVTWFTNINWPGGLAPTLTTTANKTDVFGFICTSGTYYYDGYVIGYNL